MSPIITLIADDEEPALQRVKRLLAQDPDFLLLNSCSSAKEALTILSAQKVDLLLLDMEMPAMSGLDLLNLLDDEKRPLVVFITAYDNYAVKAFEYYAIDYLLKPFSNERFTKMLTRVKNHFSGSEKKHIAWEELIRHIEKRKLPEQKIAVKTGKKYDFIAPEEIAYICADGNYCEIWLHTGKRFVHRETITHIFSILPAEKFLRIHQSSIVAIAAIKQVRRLAFGELEVQMTGGRVLKVSRKYKSELKKSVTL